MQQISSEKDTVPKPDLRGGPFLHLLPHSRFLCEVPCRAHGFLCPLLSVAHVALHEHPALEGEPVGCRPQEAGDVPGIDRWGIWGGTVRVSWPLVFHILAGREFTSLHTYCVLDFRWIRCSWAEEQAGVWQTDHILMLWGPLVFRTSSLPF